MPIRPSKSYRTKIGYQTWLSDLQIWYLGQERQYLRPPNWQSCLQSAVGGVPTAANISVVAACPCWCCCPWCSFLCFTLVLHKESVNIFYQPPPSLLWNGERWRRRKRNWNNKWKGCHQACSPRLPAHLQPRQVERCPGELPPPPNTLTPFGQSEAAAADLEDGL